MVSHPRNRIAEAVKVAIGGLVGLAVYLILVEFGVTSANWPASALASLGAIIASFWIAGSHAGSGDAQA